MKQYRITLDAGHFGNCNPSTVLPGYWESRRMWALCELLAAELELYGFEVVKTRADEEKDMRVEARGRASAGSDLFISLHSNASESPKSDFVCVFAAFDNKNGARRLGGMLAAAVSEHMGCTGGYVMTRPGANNNEYYGVLRGARKVGCPLYYIIEHSFHTNLRASKWLMDDCNLQTLAAVEAAVIAGYFGVAPAEESKVKGDLNGNGVLDPNDIAMMKRAILGKYCLSQRQLELADVNGDGELTYIDYAIAKRAYLSGKDLNKPK